MASRITRSRWGVQLALIAVAAIWGATFVVVKDAVAVYPLYAFLAWRFGVAIIAFVVLFPRALRRLSVPNLRRGVFAGLFLTAGYVFQTWGLQDTTPARSAFITGLYVVVTPLLQAVLLRRRPHLATVGGGVIALAGLWLLSGAGVGLWNAGDTRTVICALAYSVHMIVLGTTGEKHDVTALALVQITTTAVVCGAISAFTEQAGVPQGTSLWLAILATGVLASAVAFAVQTWAQRRVPPARTALILATEPAFGGLFGWSVAGAAPVREVMGAAMMLGGMVLSEAVAALAPKEAKVSFEPAVEGMPAPVIEE